MKNYRALGSLSVAIALGCITPGCGSDSVAPEGAPTTTTTGADPGSSALPAPSTPGANSSGPDNTGQDTATVPLPGSLLGAIQNNPELSQLKLAIERAQLQTELQLVAPRTLFAPSNAAFNRLSPEKAQALQQDPELLRRVLRHHLIPGALTHDELREQYVTIAGHPILIGDGPSGEAVISGGQSVAMTTDVGARSSNGVLFVLDELLWPPEDNLVQAIEKGAQFTTMAQILRVSSLRALLEQNKVRTFFVPNDRAMADFQARIGLDAFAAMLNDPAQLEAFLLPHLHGRLRSQNSLTLDQDIPSLDPSKPLLFRRLNDPVVTFTVNGRSLVSSEGTLTSNGLLIEVAGTLHDN